MTDSPTLIDPWAVPDLVEGRLDPARTICLPAPNPQVVGHAIAALANSRGGDLLLGADMAADGTLTAATGLPTDEGARLLAAGLAIVDPPVAHLVRSRLVETPAGGVLVVRVRLSPSTPHLVTDSGVIPRLEAGRLRPVTSRRELDGLYARGRGERERADRLVDAMIEKLTLAHYAFYTLAVIACTHTPSGEPYRAAADGRIAAAGDPIVERFGLRDQEAQVRPGEVELRSAGETGAYLRVTRSGCVAAGEIQRRPYHEELDTPEGLRARIEALCASVCRLLMPAADSVVVPHLFLEGVRGLRLVLDPARRATSGQAPQDTARYPLAIGDARDPDYPARLAAEAVGQIGPLFPPRE